MTEKYEYFEKTTIQKLHSFKTVLVGTRGSGNKKNLKTHKFDLNLGLFILIDKRAPLNTEHVVTSMLCVVAFLAC